VLEVCSDIIETAPWGVTDQPAFLNAVARISTVLTPHELLGRLKSAEILLGRTPGGRRWGPRTIDLDILLFGTNVVRDPHLAIPHPRLTEREFVLRQILELDREIVHPISGHPLSLFLT
jgi:2-amino-4-hydroxy-6-hydroxymethyldihydropteridine diphosphokinase